MHYTRNALVMIWRPILATLAVGMGLFSLSSLAQDQEWDTYSGDLSSTRYSPLDLINAESFSALEVAWEFDIPRTGQIGRVGTLVTKSLIIAGDGGPFTNAEGRRVAMLRAYDKMAGEELGAIEIPAQRTGSPMTYAIDGVQYLAVAVAGGDVPGRLMVYSYED